MSEIEQSFPELTRRQEDLLALIVRAYTENPEPVSSKYLVDAYDLDVSSATVRNEMARLEEMGYITAPHTSAGRIPTALGYRYVVRDFINNSALTRAERTYIENKFAELPTAIDQWMRQAAKVLSRTSYTASLVTPPIAEAGHFKHLQLISVQGRLVLLILVLQGGTVHQRMLNLAEPVPQAMLTETANHINNLCHDMSASEIRLKSRHMSELEREVAEIAADLLEKANTPPIRMIYREGLSDVINAFPHSEGAQQAVRVFEERAFLDIILNEILHPLLSENVQVVIAGDGHEELSHLSMVLSHYGLPGQMRGTLGVLGPMNLNYGRAISAVRYVSTIMTEHVSELYALDGDGVDDVSSSSS